MEYNLFELKNGIRVIHKPVKSQVAHCGFIVNTGSRDEKTKENGITHFIEHAIFKGTKKRKAYHILNRIDSVGGEINAYTTKEQTSIYASFMNIHFERAVELLSDILFNATYPAKELKKEKDVIIDEINSYQDSPYEQIYDDFEEQVFAKHPLGMNILGTTDTVKQLERKKILEFIQKNYLTNEIVFSIVGDLSLKQIERICKKHIEVIKEKSGKRRRKKFKDYKANQISLDKEVFQTHCMIGNVAYGAHDKKKKGFILLNNILGGPAMNSRLNMGIREKYGFAYNIESSYTVYSDTGLFSIYLGTDQKFMDKTVKLVMKELELLKKKKISTSQLKKAKQQLIGQITLSEENNCNVMLGMGKSLLLYKKVDGLEETFKKIENISADELQDIAQEIFRKNQLSQLIFKPK